MFSDDMTKDWEPRKLNSRKEMMELSYKYDDDSGLISFYIGGVFFEEWVAESGDPEIEFESFKKIYIAGFNDGATIKV